MESIAVRRRGDRRFSTSQDSCAGGASLKGNVPAAACASLSALRDQHLDESRGTIALLDTPA